MFRRYNCHRQNEIRYRIWIRINIIQFCTSFCTDCGSCTADTCLGEFKNVFLRVICFLLSRALKCIHKKENLVLLAMFTKVVKANVTLELYSQWVSRAEQTISNRFILEKEKMLNKLIGQAERENICNNYLHRSHAYGTAAMTNRQMHDQA